MADEPIAPPPTQAKFERTADFVSSYANSVIFEATAWDLKITVVQVDQISGQTVIKQHLAVSIPWAQAKLGAYWLQAQIAAHEIEIGKAIGIRPDVLPPPIPPVPPDQENNSVLQKYHEALRKLREEFIASLA